MKKLSQNNWSQESKDSWRSKLQNTYKEKLKAKPFEELGKAKKKQRVIEEQNYFCNKCKNDKWMGRPIPLELEHIDGNNKNDLRINLEAICPNCHAQTLTYKNRHSNKKIYSDDQIIDALKNNNSAYAAMKNLGMNPHGGHYIRFRNLIKKYQLNLGYTV